MNHPQTDTSRHRLYPASVADITLTDGFWSPKYDTFRTVTINDVFDKFERDGAFANFDRVAAVMPGEHHGLPWFDGLIYESIRAASNNLGACTRYFSLDHTFSLGKPRSAGS